MHSCPKFSLLLWDSQWCEACQKWVPCAHGPWISVPPSYPMTRALHSSWSDLWHFFQAFKIGPGFKLYSGQSDLPFSSFSIYLIVLSCKYLLLRWSVKWVWPSFNPLTTVHVQSKFSYWSNTSMKLFAGFWRALEDIFLCNFCHSFIHPKNILVFNCSIKRITVYAH